MPTDPKARYVITADDRTKAALNSARARMRSVSSSMSQMGKVAGVAAAGGLGFLTKTSLDSIDAMAKFSRRVDETMANMAGLQLQSELTGVGTKTLRSSIEAMTKRLGEAAEGSGAAQRGLEIIGMEVDELKGKNPAEQIRILSREISQLDDANEKAAATSAFFSREGLSMINMLENGEEGFRAAQKEAREFGLAVSEVDAAKVEHANDQILRASKAVEGASRRLAVQMAPIISAVADEFITLSKDTNNFASQFESAFQGPIKVVGWLADGIHGIEIVLKGAEIAALGFNSVFAMALVKISDKVTAFADLIKEGMLVPLKGALKTAALFSDEAQNALDTVNSLKIETPEALNNFAESQIQGLRYAQEELHNLLMEDLPSQIISDKLEEIATKAEEKARAAQERLNNRDSGGITVPEFDNDNSDFQETLNDRLEKVRNHLRTREGIETEAFLRRAEIVNEAQKSGTIGFLESLNLKTDLAEKYEQRLTEIAKQGASDREDFEDKSMKTQAKIVSSGFETILAGVQNENLALFRLYQAAAITRATIASVEATQDAWKWGMAWGGPPLAATFAGVAAAAGAARVGQIASQSFGSGAAGGGGAGGGGSVGQRPPQGAPRDPRGLRDRRDEDRGPGTRIIIQGDVYDGEKLVENLSKIVDEKDLTLVKSRSRNARDIREAG